MSEEDKYYWLGVLVRRLSKQFENSPCLQYQSFSDLLGSDDDIDHVERFIVEDLEKKQLVRHLSLSFDDGTVILKAFLDRSNCLGGLRALKKYWLESISKNKG